MPVPHWTGKQPIWLMPNAVPTTQFVPMSPHCDACEHVWTHAELLPDPRHCSGSGDWEQPSAALHGWSSPGSSQLPDPVPDAGGVQARPGQQSVAAVQVAPMVQAEL